MTSWTPPATELSPLLKAFRTATGTGRRSLVVLEAMLLIAQRPRTLAELEELTGISKSGMAKAVKPFTRHWIDDQMHEPELHLFNRRRIIGGRADSFKLTLTARGRRLLETAA